MQRSLCGYTTSFKERLTLRKTSRDSRLGLVHRQSASGSNIDSCSASTSSILLKILLCTMRLLKVYLLFYICQSTHISQTVDDSFVMT